MKKLALVAALALTLGLTVGACGAQAPQESLGTSRERVFVQSAQPQFLLQEAGRMQAVLSTSEGDITVVLYPEYAGRAVDNFKRLAGQGYYNDTIFHRVVNDFLIQGGDPTGTGEGGESCWGKPFPIEVSVSLRHYSGALCMAAQKGEGGGNGSQFYILATPQNALTEEELAAFQKQGMPLEIADAYHQAGGAPYLDNTDTVFGQVISGMEVVDKIAMAKADENGRPAKEIRLLSVTVTQQAAPLPVSSVASVASLPPASSATSLPASSVSP